MHIAAQMFTNNKSTLWCFLYLNRKACIAKLVLVDLNVFDTDQYLYFTFLLILNLTTRFNLVKDLFTALITGLSI